MTASTMTHNTHKALQDLLQLLMADEQHLSPQVKEFLTYAKQNLAHPEAMSEEAIATRFLKLGNWDKRNGRVRTLLTRTRDGLRDYFEDQKTSRVLVSSVRTL